VQGVCTRPGGFAEARGNAQRPKGSSTGFSCTEMRAVKKHGCRQAVLDPRLESVRFKTSFIFSCLLEVFFAESL
jgi:hypothetical protein